MKAKREITAESVKAVIKRDKPRSLTGLAHGLGYKGSVSSTLTKKLRALLPDIESRLMASGTAKEDAGGDAKAKKDKPDRKRKAKPATSPASKWPHDERSKFRPGSSYDTCYSILAAHKDGLPRGKLVALLAEATDKDTKHAGFDAQVLLSAHPNEDGLSNNDSPRHRSCRPGFYIVRNGDVVTLKVD